MSQAVLDLALSDNPLTLAALSSFSIVQNIAHFVNEETISGKAFYLWKDGIVLSDLAIEQIFQATLEHRRELSAQWLTLFLGSRRLAQQLITRLVNPSVLGAQTYSHLLAERYSSVGRPHEMRYENVNSTVNSPLSDLSIIPPLFPSSNSAQTFSPDDFPARADEINFNPPADSNNTTCAASFINNSNDMKQLTCDSQEPNCKRSRDFGRRSPSQVTQIRLSYCENSVTFDSDMQSTGVLFTPTNDSDQQLLPAIAPFVIFKNRSGANADTKHEAIDCTGIIKRLVIQHNVSMPSLELLSGLLACAEPLEIILTDCSKLDSNFEILELIVAHFARLRTLKLYRCGILLSKCFQHSPLSAGVMAHFASGFDLSHLRVLALHELPAAATSPDYCLLLFHVADRLSTHLLELDLSGADFTSCTSFGWLSRLRLLRMLLLADCRLPDDRSLLIGAICELPELIRLDLRLLRREQLLNPVDEFDNPAQVLQQLSESLPQLDHLDLSGTNLPGTGQDVSAENPLPGWPTGRKLSFLGLWGCPSDACFRENLPAHRIAGEANVEQVIVALEAFADVRHATVHILDSLHHVLEGSDVLPPAAHRCLDLLLERLQRYPNDRPQAIEFMAITQLLRAMQIENTSQLLVRRLVQYQIDTIERCFENADTVRRSCSILFKVPTYNQLSSLYERLLKLLFRIAQHQPFSQRSFYQPVQATALDLLRWIVRQVDFREKRVFGEAGGVQVALSVIEQQLNVADGDDSDDDIISSSWRLLCSATDEMHCNCELFVKLGGLELFVRCVQKWADHNAELIGSLLIAITNVSEVKSLRGHLKSDQFIGILRELLDMPSENNRISFCTAAVLAQLLADGEPLWHRRTDSDDETQPPDALSFFSHAAVCDQLVAAIDKWNSNTDFLIVYRSLQPLLSLIASFESFGSQYWAAWALNNLTLNKPDTYCPMLVREGALDLLDAAIADTRTSVKLNHLLELIVVRIRDHIKKQQRSDASSSPLHLVAGELIDIDDNDGDEFF